MSSIPTRSFTRGLFGSFAGNVVAQGLGLTSGVLAARYLGPQGRGELATIRFYPTLLALLGSFGVQQAVAFALSRRPDDEGRILRAGFWLSLMIALPQILLAAALIPYLISHDKRYLTSETQCYFVYVVVDYARMTLLSVDQGAFRFQRYNVFKILPLVGFVAGIGVMVWLDMVSSHYFALCYQLGPLIALLVQISFAWKHLSAGWPQTEDLRMLYKSGMQFQLPHFLGHLMEHGSLFIVVTVLPSEDVGLFMVALAIAMAQFATAIAFMQVGFVKIAGEASRALALAALIRQFRASQLAMFGLSCIMLAASPHLIRMGFGEKFLAASGATYWMIAAMGTMGLIKILDGGLRALDYTRAPAIGYAAGLLVLIVGGFGLVPSGGIMRMGQVAFFSALMTLIVDCALFVRLEKLSAPALWGLNRQTIQLVSSRIGQLILQSRVVSKTN
jgi:O-antigen/teichoic acid export membrane protein